MAETILDFTGTVIVAEEFRGGVTPAVGSITNSEISEEAAISSNKVHVNAYAPGGVTADTLQATIAALADRITALEP